ncbi:MAG: response regulator transcription factor [Paracoccaceae bacterium]
MPKRVLLVEDEPNIVESLKFLLARAGFEVVVQANGREGLQAARSAPPDVLILDVMLPEINGIEVLRQLRAEDTGSDLPILMLTAKGQREDRERAIEAGADIFLTKPFANADLVSAVQSLADGRPG